MNYLKLYGHKENEEIFIRAKKKAEGEYKEFKKFFKVFLKLDKLNLNNKIIIRPHPADDLKLWNKIGKRFKNILIIFDGDISEWLYASNGLMHRGCTTALQSVLSNKPTAYLASDQNFIRETLTYDISEKLNNMEKIIDFINSPQLKKIKTDIENIVHLDQNNSACHNILEDISNLGSKQTNPINIKFFDVFKQNCMSLKNKYINRYNRVKMGNGINLDETVLYLNIIRGKKDFIVKKIFNDCLMIEKKNY